MVEFNDTRYGAVRSHSGLGRWARRLFGFACLLAVPGILVSTIGALPEARILGLALSLVIAAVAGFCLVSRR